MPNDTAVALTAAPPPPIVFNEKDAFELALRKAKVYSSSTLVPAQYQDNIPNCLIAMNMARRIGSDELQTMQNLYIVQGKPGWSGQFLIATFNQCGKFSALRFEWKGNQGEKDWGCRAYATEKATGQKIVGSWITWKMVEAEGWSKKSGSKWLTMPDQMFMYRAAAFLVRTHAPEIAMGLQTVEELRDVIDVEAEPAPTKAAALANVLKERLTPPDTSAAPAPIETSGKAPDAPATTASDLAGGYSYAQVRDALEKASTDDAKALAVDMIRNVTDPAHRHELTGLAKSLGYIKD